MAYGFRTQVPHHGPPHASSPREALPQRRLRVRQVDAVAHAFHKTQEPVVQRRVSLERRVVAVQEQRRLLFSREDVRAACFQLSYPRVLCCQSRLQQGWCERTCEERQRCEQPSVHRVHRASVRVGSMQHSSCSK